MKKDNTTWQEIDLMLEEAQRMLDRSHAMLLEVKRICDKSNKVRVKAQKLSVIIADMRKKKHAKSK